MMGSNNSKQTRKREEVNRILKYVRKPWIVTSIITGGLVVLAVLVLLLLGQLENFIVYFDLRYNSPALIMLAVIVLAVQIGACFYGVLLSLKKYRRPGAKGVINRKYSQGTSYLALNDVVNSPKKG